MIQSGLYLNILYHTENSMNNVHIFMLAQPLQISHIIDKRCLEKTHRILGTVPYSNKCGQPCHEIIIDISTHRNGSPFDGDILEAPVQVGRTMSKLSPHRSQARNFPFSNETHTATCVESVCVCMCVWVDNFALNYWQPSQASESEASATRQSFNGQLFVVNCLWHNLGWKLGSIFNQLLIFYPLIHGRNVRYSMEREPRRWSNASMSLRRPEM